MGVQVAAVEKEKEQINAQYMELWRKNYAQPSETTDSNTVSKVVELETALESREGRLKQLSLQVSCSPHVPAHPYLCDDPARSPSDARVCNAGGNTGGIPAEGA